MCRECASSSVRGRAASEFLAQCRVFNPFHSALKEAFPISHALPDDMARMVAQLDRGITP